MRVQKGGISSNWTSGGVNERQVVRVGGAGDWDNRRRSAAGGASPFRSSICKGREAEIFEDSGPA